MPRNKAQAHSITLRRENVARLRLRGLSMREIAVALAQLNPPIVGDEGKPFDVAQIHRDLKVLTAEWRQRAAEAIDERKSRQLAEIDEAKRKSWTDGDLSALARFLKLESDIFGTMAPVKVIMDWRKEALEAGVDPDALVADLFSKVKSVSNEPGNTPA